jgi:hypothetical protein
VMAVAGLVPMRRGGHRAEASVITAIAIVYFLYNAGYWLPMGGNTPGPRFLIPTLPFLALGLAFAYKEWPATTLALSIPSAALMVLGSITFPLLGEDGIGTWADYLTSGTLQHSVFTALTSNAWLAITPVIAAIALAVVLAAVATPRTPVCDLRPAVAAVIAWAALSAVGPTIVGNEVQPLDGDPHALWLVAIPAAIALVALTAIRLYQGPRASPQAQTDG